MRYLVTGGAGFLGSHLCDLILSRGGEVWCVDDLSTGSRENIAHLEDDPLFHFIEHNIISPLALPERMDYVFHLASPASPIDYKRLPFYTLRTGSEGTYNSLEIARKDGAHFLMASTSEIYGDPLRHPQQESYFGNVNPIGERAVYDEAKRYAEAMTSAFHRYHQVKTHIVRIFNTYGPRMQVNDGRVVPNLMCQALRGEPLTVYGSGEQTRSFCYYSDLLEGIYRLGHSEVHEPVNIGNPVEFTINEFARVVKAITGTSAPIIHADWPDKDDPKQRQPDISKAKELLGWTPQVPLEEGLKPTLEYFRKKLGL